MASFPQINKIWHFLASRVFSGNSKWGIRIAGKNFFPFRKVSPGEEIPTSSFVLANIILGGSQYETTQV
jgi:hypothetical protein